VKPTRSQLAPQCRGPQYDDRELAAQTQALFGEPILTGWCTPVSAINGCGTCVDSHEKVLREKGFSEEKIMAAARIASVLHAIALVLDTERVAAHQPVTS